MVTYDCIVVGAGYPGLAAAKELKYHGTSVLLLEAKDRIGGRVMTKSYEDGSYFDFGGSYLGPGQTQMYQLAKEFGIQTFSLRKKGEKLVYHFRDKRKTYSGLIPPLSVLELLDVHLIIRSIETASKAINMERPWETPKAKGLDNITLETWMKSHGWTKAARDSMRLIAETVWGKTTDEVSMLHTLFYTRAGQGLTNLCSSENGAQNELMKGGAQGIADGISQYLEGAVHIGEPVLSIDQSNQDIVISNTSISSYITQHVIIAVPPAQVLQVKFTPALPPLQRNFIQAWTAGGYWKFFAVYSTAFWRKQGLSGEGTCPDRSVQVTFDYSPPDGGNGVLMVFVAATKAREFHGHTSCARKQIVLEDLVAFFGENAKTPEKFVEHTMMDEEFIKGCPVAVPKPGAWAQGGEHWRKPFYKVHWAGTETSSVWTGYMEGAVCSGQRAAKEVLEV